MVVCHLEYKTPQKLSGSKNPYSTQRVCEPLGKGFKLFSVLKWDWRTSWTKV